LIDAVTRSASVKECGPKAESILSLLLENKRLPRPDVVTYCTVMKAWGKSDKPSKAEALLNRMEESWTSSSSKSYLIKPTTSAFNSVISAYKESTIPDISEHVSRLRMRKKFFCTEGR